MLPLLHFGKTTQKHTGSQWVSMLFIGHMALNSQAQQKSFFTLYGLYMQKSSSWGADLGGNAMVLMPACLHMGFQPPSRSLLFPRGCFLTAPSAGGFSSYDLVLSAGWYYYPATPAPTQHWNLKRNGHMAARAEATVGSRA